MKDRNFRIIHGCRVFECRFILVFVYFWRDFLNDLVFLECSTVYRTLCTSSSFSLPVHASNHQMEYACIEFSHTNKVWQWYMIRLYSYISTKTPCVQFWHLFLHLQVFFMKRRRAITTKFFHFKITQTHIVHLPMNLCRVRCVNFFPIFLRSQGTSPLPGFALSPGAHKETWTDAPGHTAAIYAARAQLRPVLFEGVGADGGGEKIGLKYPKKIHVPKVKSQVAISMLKKRRGKW